MLYEVDLELFKGPLDLLLYLIRKDEISIREIEISRITDQYMAYIQALQELDLDLAGDFLVMAAVLMRLKARELLPQSEREKLDDDPDFIDREKLIKQIEEYEQFKQIATTLKEREEENFGSFYRSKAEGITFSADDFLAQKDVEIYDLLIAFKRVMETAKQAPQYYMEADNVTIDDRIESVLSQITESKTLPFSKLFEDDPRKIVLVVTFMAILELIRMQLISFSQDSDLGEIWISEKEQSEDGKAVNMIERAGSNTEMKPDTEEKNEEKAEEKNE
ncbi:MAG: segregation/condensation protein A [Fibrobacteres bacterium]|nr:segregation/condensation protein A [Fibrobacterota bacterium]